MDKVDQIRLTNIILIILLILGLIWMFSEFKAISKAGVMCAKSPFVYGAQEISKQYDNSFVDCSCIMAEQHSFKFNTTTFIPGIYEIQNPLFGDIDAQIVNLSQKINSIPLK